MCHLKRVIDLNNRVVFLLKCNQVHEAILSSSSAMDQFQELAMVDDKQLLRPGNNFIDQCIIASNLDTPSRNHDSLDDYIYDRGIILPSTLSDPTVITPILIFNTALCHQLFASSCSNSNQEKNVSEAKALLLKAKHLYKLAFSGQYQDFNTAFKIAIINNTAVICKKLDEFKNAEECFQYLESSMVLLVEIGACEELGQLLSGVWANIWTNGKTAAAA